METTFNKIYMQFNLITIFFLFLRNNFEVICIRYDVASLQFESKKLAFHNGLIHVDTKFLKDDNFNKTTVYSTLQLKFNQKIF